MNIAQRVKALHLPLNQIVVIGSGLLDVLELRPSRDIDLAVDAPLFHIMRTSGDYNESMRHDEPVLEREDVEAWRNWGNEYGFSLLKSSALLIEDVYFCHPRIILDHKRARATQKDKRDIQLLETYIMNHPQQFN